MIEVVNMLHTRGFGKPGDFRADRETKWGNPFIMYEQHMRNRVCDLYEDYLDAITEPNNQQMVRNMLKIGGLTPVQVDHWMEKTGGYLDINELEGAKRLFCWCAKERCHCDYLKKNWNNRIFYMSIVKLNIKILIQVCHLMEIHKYYMTTAK